MKILLFILISFIGITATLSGLYMISNPGGAVMNLDPALLKNTPFKNFLIPGIILSIVAGGINLVAAFFNIQRHPHRYNWAMAGGLMISGWIITQIIMISAVSWLQCIYLVSGLLIILIAYQLKGKWAA
jgi:hypothetical protein